MSCNVNQFFKSKCIPAFIRFVKATTITSTTHETTPTDTETPEIEPETMSDETVIITTTTTKHDKTNTTEMKGTLTIQIISSTS